MDGYELLSRALHQVAVPAAPVLDSGEGAAIGLSFLETSLRLNHVRRLTERVTLSEHGSANKTTELDISLGLLDSSQLAASEHFNALHSKGEVAESSSEARPPTWVPIARLPTSSSSPVDVFDAEHRRLTRLTQYETSRLIAAGLFRLLRSILASQTTRNTNILGTSQAPQASEAYRLLTRMDESRWLIESAIYSLLTTRGQPPHDYLNLKITSGTRPGPSAAIRQFAFDVIDAYRQELQGFFDLVQIAFNDYILVAALPDADEHVLQYESPTFAQARSGISLRRLALTDITAYRVDYSSQLPASLRSYHLVINTDPDVAIDTVYLSTNVEDQIVSRLAEDLTDVAKKVDQMSAGGLPPHDEKYLEIEAQTAIRASADALRRRAWEADLTGQAVDQGSTRQLRKLGWVVTSGEAGVAPDGSAHASLLRHPLVSTDTLRGAAEELRGSEIGWTLSCSTDPPSAISHSYWRRNTELAMRTGQIGVDARIILRDGSENRPRRILLYSVAMALLTWLLASFLAHGIWPLSWARPENLQSDALVAVLLLVPGFLYSRFDLGRRGSVAAQLRRPSQIAGIVSVASCAVAAAAVAANGAIITINSVFAIAIAMPILFSIWLGVRSRDHDGSNGISEVDPARWIARRSDRVAEVGMSVASVQSDTVGPR